MNVQVATFAIRRPVHLLVPNIEIKEHLLGDIFWESQRFFFILAVVSDKEEVDPFQISIGFLFFFLISEILVEGPSSQFRNWMSFSSKR